MRNSKKNSCTLGQFVKQIRWRRAEHQNTFLFTRIINEYLLLYIHRNVLLTASNGTELKQIWKKKQKMCSWAYSNGSWKKLFVYLRELSKPRHKLALSPRELFNIQISRSIRMKRVENGPAYMCVYVDMYVYEYIHRYVCMYKYT